MAAGMSPNKYTLNTKSPRHMCFSVKNLFFFLLNSAKDRISTFPNGAKKIKKHKTVFVQHHRPNHRYLGLENPDPVMAGEVPAVPAALK